MAKALGGTLYTPMWISGASIGVAGSTGILAAADHALRRLRELGVDFPNDSRLERARELVREVHESGVLPDDRLRLAEATRTVFEMYWITRALGSGPGPLGQLLDQKLNLILSGPDIPDDESDHTIIARNTQFELFVGAWLAAGGLEIRLAEPDLVFLFNGQLIGVAAKRVRSRRQLVRRTRAAIKQVEKRTGTGVVALNVDRLLNELVLKGQASERGALFEAQVPELSRALALVEAHQTIKALLALGFHFEWALDRERPRLEMASFTKWQFFPNDDEEFAYVQRFQANFARMQEQRLQRF